MRQRAHGRKPPGRIQAVYDYVDQQGKLLFQVVRYVPKGFSYRRPNPRGGWTLGPGRAQQVLYRLPELQAAPPEKPVYIVEGEKDVDRLHSLGLLATCNSG